MNAKIDRSEILKIIQNYSVISREKDYCCDIDPYCKERPLMHSMACAVNCIASCELYKVTGKQEYFEDARRCGGILEKLQSRGEPGACWGLPHEWKEKPVNHPYMITTVICGDAFLALYELTKSGEYAGKLNEIVDWILQRQFWRFFSPDAACPIYAPDFEIYASNVASKTASFLLRAAPHINKRQEALRYSDYAYKFVLNQQHWFGFWRYDISSDIIDNKHTAFIIEGLIDGYQITKNKRFKKAIKKGISFYETQLYPSFGVERVRIVNSDHAASLRSLRGNFTIRRAAYSLLMLAIERKTLFHGMVESRLWGYGAALIMLCKAQALGFKSRCFAERILSYIKTSLLAENGRFYYTKADPTHYIRHEAFVYLGLAMALREFCSSKGDF